MDICQRMFVLCLQAQEVGKVAGRFLFWLEICQPHGPLGLLVDDMGGGNRGEKSSFIPSTSAGGPLCSRPEQAARSGYRDVPCLKESQIITDNKI